MSRKAMNLPSSATKGKAFGGERGGAIELFDDGTTFFSRRYVAPDKDEIRCCK